MAFQHYVRNGTKQLRMGYTTGTCAALASLAAVRFLLSGACPETVSVMTKKGIPVTAAVEDSGQDGKRVFCAVRKDAGDDIDVTDGILIYASVERMEKPEIRIDGGRGVGRVTKPGLDQPVGNAAINSGPREMIREAVQRACLEENYRGGMDVCIYVPEGEKAAARTFNPEMGIQGGISILGTSGIVEPMSEKALVDTIELEIHQKAGESENMIFIPGNYGEEFMAEAGLDQTDLPVVKISNFLGDALDIAAAEGIRKVLLISHAGKLVKVAGGVMNTHSRYADCRTELFCAHAAVCGASAEVCSQLLSAATTDACIEILDAAGIREAVMERLMNAIQHHLDRRAAGAFEIGAVMFSRVYGLLGVTEPARKLMRQWELQLPEREHGSKN